VNVRVRLAAQAETTLTLHVEVTDTGIGIPPEKQQAVFEAFTQADGSTTRKYGGTGLGLSIASKLVSLMDGRLWLESEPGHGSRFHFTVVLTPHPAARPGVVAVGIESGDATQRAAARAKCVLMADDSPLHRELLSHLLRARGYEVLTAADGREAVEAFKAGAIDAVILDWQMPEMDGLQTTQAIRRAERGGNARVPIIAATAAVRPEDRSRGIAAGVDCFLTKPIPTGTLLAILESGPVTGVAPGVDVETGRKELLTRLGDADLARRMIDLFLGEGPRLLGELRGALLGAIANFPSVEARDVAAQMERYGLAGDFESAERLFPELQEAVRQLALQLPALF
jgi:CheY-like chemotaxis protein